MATTRDRTEHITALLRAWGAGNDDALARLIPEVEPELHRIAQRYMQGERRDVRQ